MTMEQHDGNGIWTWTLAVGAWALVSVAAVGCGTTSARHHEMGWTKGRVRFAPSSHRFYAERWSTVYKATQTPLCAGFVHKKTFGRYLAYGDFVLHMKMEVFKGGTPVIQNGEMVDWTGGRLLRTLEKTRPIREKQDAYLWCAKLRDGGRWKVGGMRFTFFLRRKDPPMDVPLAKGIVRIVP
ncbi:MAG: hypothetical protein J7M25_02165 [Deltaproteobacteria bacterium]|nr:hypothetical protein [Deltaproteobacteria bacterium]